MLPLQDDRLIQLPSEDEDVVERDDFTVSRPNVRAICAPCSVCVFICVHVCCKCIIVHVLCLSCMCVVSIEWYALCLLCL